MSDSNALARGARSIIRDVLLLAATLVLNTAATAGPIRVIEESRGVEQYFDVPGDDSGRWTSCDVHLFRIWIADTPAELASLRTWNGRGGECQTLAVLDTSGAIRVARVPMASGSPDAVFADRWHRKSEAQTSHLPDWYVAAREANPEAYGVSEEESGEPACQSAFLADALEDGITHLEFLGFSPKGLAAYMVNGELVIQNLTTDRIVERKFVACEGVDRLLKSRKIVPLASRPTAWSHQTLVWDGDPLTLKVVETLEHDPAGSWLWSVELHSRARGRKALGSVRLRERAPQVVVAGFVVSPFEDRAAVIVHTGTGGVPAVFGAHLTKGFAK